MTAPPGPAAESAQGAANTGAVAGAYGGGHVRDAEDGAQGPEYPSQHPAATAQQPTHSGQAAQAASGPGGAAKNTTTGQASCIAPTA